MKLGAMDQQLRTTWREEVAQTTHEYRTSCKDKKKKKMTQSMKLYSSILYVRQEILKNPPPCGVYYTVRILGKAIFLTPLADFFAYLKKICHLISQLQTVGFGISDKTLSRFWFKS